MFLEASRRKCSSVVLDPRLVSIKEKVLDPEHPSLAATLNNRAELLRQQVRVARKIQEISCGSC